MLPSDTGRRDGYILPPCIPTRAYRVPSGLGWVQHDGYRLQVRRDGDRVRLFTRRGLDWSERCPAIARTAAALRCTSLTLDGEAVACGPTFGLSASGNNPYRYSHVCPLPKFRPPTT
jgi:hypothetical protein